VELHVKSGAAAGKNIGGIAVNEIEDYNAESSALNELIALTKDIQAYNASKGKYISYHSHRACDGSY
jgi:hypothetical protein